MKSPVLSQDINFFRMGFFHGPDDFIPAGDIPPNPSELLGSTRMSDLLSYLASDHVVIVDAPPVLPVTDAVALADPTDGVLLVIRSGSTTEDQLRRAAASRASRSRRAMPMCAYSRPPTAWEWGSSSAG